VNMARVVKSTPFVTWWRVLNAALAQRGKPEARHAEAVRWYRELNPTPGRSKLSPEVVTHILNERERTSAPNDY